MAKSAQKRLRSARDGVCVKIAWVAHYRLLNCQNYIGEGEVEDEAELACLFMLVEEEVENTDEDGAGEREHGARETDPVELVEYFGLGVVAVAVAAVVLHLIWLLLLKTIMLVKQEPAYLKQEPKREWDGDGVTQEDTWHVVRAFFQQHGLVAQQMASYNNFLERTLQEVIEENNLITIQQEPQYNPGEEVLSRCRYEIEFKQVYCERRPRTLEMDEQVTQPYPFEARMRNLTYELQISSDIEIRQYKIDDEDGDEAR